MAVTSGKGGVGKTSMAVNLAGSLRMFGAKVLLLDADMGLGNVDVLLGLEVQLSLKDVLLHGRPIEHVVLDGPLGLKILPGASGVERLARLPEHKIQTFLCQVESYCEDMDFVIVDTSPGVSPSVINCLMAADEVLLVTTPEPAALTDAYGLLKITSRRPEAADKPILLIMNQIDSKEEALRAFDRLRLAAERFLDLRVEYLGSVVRDDTVTEASKRQVDFLTHYAGAPCTRDVRKIAARLVSSGPDGDSGRGRFFRRMMQIDDE